MGYHLDKDLMFAPSRVRGLKLGTLGKFILLIVRTFTGAWIETMLRKILSRSSRFAPSRVRGLKLVSVRAKTKAMQFAPSRVRGLKLLNR